MRLSAESSSPNYHMQKLLDMGIDPHSLRVVFNGRHTNLVIEADDRAGWIRTMVQGDGKIVQTFDPSCGYRVKEVVLHGKVRFEWQRM